jgi:hypothetical protein
MMRAKQAERTAAMGEGNQMGENPDVEMTNDGLGSVLVTGATGIVGWSIVNALYEQAQRVRVMAATSSVPARFYLPAST